MLLDLYISYFQNPDITELSYNSVNGAFYPNISLKLQKVTFGARKMKKKTLLKSFLYFGKWNFLAVFILSFLMFSFLNLEVKNIDFVLSSPKCLLSTNQSYISENIYLHLTL